ncbi:MAG: NAD(P)-dependent alcohol dehydrogenase [Acidobacteriota bacterium]
MRAAVYGHHGVHIEEVERPVPGDDEVLLKVHAASLNAPDWRVMSVSPLLRRLMFAIAKTRRPGRDVAGIVEAAGRKITQFKPGDAVFGCASGSCADYACAREAWLVPKPETISFEQAACVAVSGLTALQGLRDKGKLQPGQTVLINGGTGAVGTFAVQIAKALGGETTAVCSTRNVDLVRSLGADHVIDYSKEDFTKGSQRYDVIFDVVGNRSLSSCGRLLTPTGSFVMVGGPKQAWAVLIRALTAFVRSRLSSRFRMFMARLRKDDLAALTDLITAGKVTPTIDRSYPLGNIAEAMQYAGKGHSRAKVVITM